MKKNAWLVVVVVVIVALALYYIFVGQVAYSPKLNLLGDIKTVAYTAGMTLQCNQMTVVSATEADFHGGVTCQVTSGDHHCTAADIATQVNVKCAFPCAKITQSTDTPLCQDTSGFIDDDNPETPLQQVSGAFTSCTVKKDIYCLPVR